MVGDMPPEPSRDDSSTGTSFHSPQLKFLYESLDIQNPKPWYTSPEIFFLENQVSELRRESYKIKFIMH